DLRSEKIGKKIRDAQLEKVPYMLVIGEAEAQSGEVAVRKRGEGDIGKLPLDEFIALVKKQVENRELW
ncbi:MAG: threonine--tRNA ligase, partial [Clostridia bacterium]|nr:threonine--tRNA ligase [Clostridia bacterium]